MIELKTDPLVFEADYSGSKTFEIRFNDRGYKVGDVLHLRETTYDGQQMLAGNPLAYTGRSMVVQVTHVLSGYGLASGWVCLSFKRVEPQPVSQSSAEILASKWEAKLREVGGMDNELVSVPAAGVRALLQEVRQLPTTGALMSCREPVNAGEAQMQVGVALKLIEQYIAGPHYIDTPGMRRIKAAIEPQPLSGLTRAQLEAQCVAAWGLPDGYLEEWLRGAPKPRNNQ